MVNRFVSLPKPLQAAMVLAGGGGIVAALYYLLSGRMLFVLLIAVVLVTVLLLVYRAILKSGRKRKAARMEKSIAAHSAAAPAAASAPAARARLDDMRKSFEDGVAKFRAVGKNLYELPWYVMVGESGSGKTEAIRHCNIGFPPGLQDRLQGVGGTLNMNWWFTDNAVLLDTAGRLMFEDTATAEWREFLKLLIANRANCPINGMLLVIPADSLIKDTAEEIEKKGSRIAQQLDHIQRELGVRFPVFVVVTKCDLVNGFREFFDNLRDPQLQHQILGWSNPDSLDQPFDPSKIDQHIETVRARLYRRRGRLLMDPPHGPEGTERRTDLVDSLYSFPEGLSRIVPRLKRYLEMVFVAGAWSARPLFLRGIYFTSSMREGSALDADLSEMLGVPVESLPEGKIWAEDRAYFLRDLFVNKIFKEQGLVTSATNARRSQRRRRAAVMAAGFVAVVALFALTWLGARSLAQSIGRNRDYWQAAAREENWESGNRWNPIISQEFRGSTEYVYEGDRELEVAGEKIKLADFHARLLAQAGQETRIPWVFRFAAKLGQSINADRVRAHRRVFESSVLQPLADAGRHKMSAENNAEHPWTPAATGSLVQLLQAETKLQKPDRQGKFMLEPLLSLVLSQQQRARLSDDQLGKFQQSLDWSFDNDVFDGDDRGWGWLCRSLNAGREQAHKAVFVSGGEAAGAGLNRFIDHWSNLTDRGGDEATLLKLLEESFPALAQDLLAYQKAESALLRTSDDVLHANAAVGPVNLDEWTLASDAWRDVRFAELQSAKAKLDDRLKKLRGELAKVEEIVTVRPGQGNWLGRAYQEVFTQLAERKKKTFDVLLEALPAAADQSTGSQGQWLGEVRAALEEAQQTIESRIRRPELEATLAKLDEEFFTTMPVNEDLRDTVVSLLTSDAAQSASMGASTTVGGEADGSSPQVAALLRRAGLADSLREKKAWTVLEARYAIYALADDQISKVDTSVKADSLPATIAQVDEGIARTRSAAENIWHEHRKVLAPAEQSPIASMGDFVDFALDRVAKRGRIYHILYALLTADRPTGESILKQVATTAKSMDIPKIPALPMTNTDTDGSGAVIVQYHPAAAKLVLQGWLAVGPYLSANEKDKTLFVLQADKLADLYEQWNLACKQYAADYLKFWVQTVPGYLDVEADKDWPGFRTRLQTASMQIRPVRASLRNVCEIIINALTHLRPLAPKTVGEEFAKAIENLTEARQKLDGIYWGNDAQEVLDTWLNLPDDVTYVREAILALSPNKFMSRYIPFIAEGDDPVVKKYMLDIVTKGLSVLAEQSQRDGRKGWGQLKSNYAAFPLLRPDPAGGGAELTAKQIGQAQRLLAQIGYRSEKTASVGQTARTIGEGGTTGYSAVDAKLLLLRELQLTGAEKTLLGKLGKVAFCLPSMETAQAELFAPPLAQQPSKSFFHYWAGGVQLKQGSVTGRRIGVFSEGIEQLGKIKYGLGAPPAAVQVFRFPGANPAEAPNREVVLEGPWAALRLLHPGRAKGKQDVGATHEWKIEDRSDDGLTWRVQLTIDAGRPDSERTILLGLRFQAELPRIEDWPTESDFTAATAP